MNEVVITGYGVVSPIGIGVSSFEKKLFLGESGVVSIRNKIVAEKFPVPYAAVIDRKLLATPDLMKDWDTQSIAKSWLMAYWATHEAITQLPDDLPIDSVVYGTADGISFDLYVETLRKLDLKKFDMRQTCSESSLDIIQLLLNQRKSKIAAHQMVCVNAACATGNQALGIAYQNIKSGRWQRCLAGGVDARCEPSNFMNFFMLGAVTTADVPPHEASRPFAADRTGFVRGEGAATFLLESKEAALRRGAKILGKVIGYGFTSDAFRLTDGRDDCESVIHAMEMALKTSGLKKDEVDYISAHGTSTKLNDRLETLAIKKVFSDRAYHIPISSVKSQIGHSTIAAGAIEAAAALLMLKNQEVSPTINYNVPDPECDLDYVPNKSRKLKVRNILSNSFGFGGQNACLMLQAADESGAN